MNLRFGLVLPLAINSFFLSGAQADFGLQDRRSASLPLRGGSVTRAAWGAKPKEEKVTVKTPSATRRSPQQSRKEKDAISEFLSRDSRTTFIGRVYGILTLQLAVTAGVITLFDRNKHWARSMATSSALGPAAIPGASLVLSTIAWYTMSKSASARRNVMGWGLLTLFTACEAVSVAFITSFFKFHSVVKTMGITALATAVVGLYTILNKNPRYDLSQWGHSISSCGMVILSFGIEHLLELVGVLPKGFMPYSDFWYSAASACLFCAYLAYHTRLIVAGKYAKYQMSEKDYIFGAITLYNDMINLFIYVLKMLGEEDH